MSTISEYFSQLPADLQPLASKLQSMFDAELPHCKTKVWHAIPVWFDDGNPIVTYFEKKGKLFVMFWNGQNFEQSGLNAVGKYSAADIHIESLENFDEGQMGSWLHEAKNKPQTDIAMRVKL